MPVRLRQVNELEAIIRREIRDVGPMRFDRFMELALYHPSLGYYARPRAVGRTGDFMTSVSVGPLFGRLLARQVRQMARHLAEPEFWIFEQGAHDGRLAHDILSSLWANDPAFFSGIRYAVIEPQAAARERQRRTLENFGDTVCWIERIEGWEGRASSGVILSNELVDAFPVRLIERGQDAWLERCVVFGKDESLGWRLESVVDPDLQDAIDGLPLPPVPGYRTEINLAAPRWMRKIATFLRRGYLLTLDYGFPASLYYAPFRRDGTLTAYHRHHRCDNVLSKPGHQDITAHVDFTALVRSGENEGLTTLGLVDQARFLTGIAHDELDGTAQFQPALSAETRAWQMLTHPQHFGGRFHALLQARDAPGDLDGLRYVRPGGWD